MSPTKAKTEPVGMGAPTGGATGPNSAPSQEMKAAQGAAMDNIVAKLERWRELSLKKLEDSKKWNCTELISVKNPLGNGRATLQICVNKALTQKAILKFYVSSPMSATYIKSVDQLDALILFAKKLLATSDKLREVMAWAEGNETKIDNTEEIDLELEL